MNLSIIILTCNQAATTTALLDSLDPLMLHHNDVEIILIDNGSTDGTLLSIGNRNYSWQNRLKAISNTTNIGVAAGRNMGLKQASGDIIMFLDNDTIVSSTAIRQLYHHVKNNHATGIAAPALLSANGVLQDSAKPFPGILLKLRHAIGLKKLTNSEQKSMAAKHPCYVIGACQAFRKQLIDTIGMLDEHIFYGPEDADFCLRASSAGFTIDYLPHIKITHHWQRATRRNPLSALALTHLKALIYFYIKHRRCI